MAQLVKNPPAMKETWVWSLGWEDPWRRERLPTPVFWPGENNMDCIVHGVAKSWTQLSNVHFYFQSLVFWKTIIFHLSHWKLFPVLLFHLIKRLFSSNSLSTIRVVSSEYLKLLIFLPAILFPAYDSSSLASLMMYSAYTLLMNTQVNSIQPWRTLFPILNQFIALCPVITVAS